MSVSRRHSPSRESTISELFTHELMRELDLAHKKTQKLKLETDAPKIIEEYQDSVQQEVERSGFETAQLVQTCMGLSARQLPKFDGNLADYHSFMSSSMSTFAQHTRDPAD
ncbi:hypothetical protein X801_02429 [Opisthorchis viverrini]|uniref:Uncharacterized protein n=1 Tax=Opisthorchis viverrini TaxID=6198 RepID=A0A1S8X4U9_OPIVI|nr:hypothetical protein X801_02429 [Opisthorchis viverrini]